METRSHLTPKLKSLRLSGILETLDVRNQQAIEEKCTYVEFLEKLIEDEVERRGQKQLSLRLRRSCLDPAKTLEAFNFSFNPAINRAQIYDLATCAFVERSESLFLIGPAGVGKSHLAHAMGHEGCRRGYDVVFTRTSAMLAHINGGRADGTYERRLATYQRPEVLILDDFGLKPMRPPAAEDLYEVIEGRYGHGAIVLTTNRAFNEWPELSRTRSSRQRRWIASPTVRRRSSSRATATGPRDRALAPRRSRADDVSPSPSATSWRTRPRAGRARPREPPEAGLLLWVRSGRTI